MRHVGYMLCECRVHGRVCAKHFQEFEGGSDRPENYFSCPGTEGDTGGCQEQPASLNEPCVRPSWAEYPDEHVA